MKSSNNWGLFYYQFDQDHSKPDLIWNFKTRQELKDGLETEIQAFLQVVHHRLEPVLQAITLKLRAIIKATHF